jgi:hypothetical protein
MIPIIRDSGGDPTHATQNAQHTTRSTQPGTRITAELPSPTIFSLDVQRVGFYFRAMKRIYFFLITAALCTGPSVSLRAQDAAAQERLDKMAGQVATVMENQEALRKKIEDLEKAIDHLRAQMDKPSGNYASQDYVKQLYESVKDLDRKRIDDNEKLKADMKSEFEKLRKLMTSSASRTPPPTPGTTTDDPKGKKAGPSPEEKGYWHVVKEGELLSNIVKAYRDDKKTTATLDQVIKANSGLKPDKIYAGQKIFIPAAP